MIGPATSFAPRLAPTGIEAMVCEEIARRQQMGIAKYGQTVAENPLALRDWLQHAYEEALDQAIYLKRAIVMIDRNEVARTRPFDDRHDASLDLKPGPRAQSVKAEFPFTEEERRQFIERQMRNELQQAAQTAPENLRRV